MVILVRKKVGSLQFGHLEAERILHTVWVILRKEYLAV